MTPREIEEEARAVEQLAEDVRTSRAELAVRRQRLERARLEQKKAEWRAALRFSAPNEKPRAFKESDE
jgi:hypothetical protein